MQSGSPQSSFAWVATRDQRYAVPVQDREIESALSPGSASAVPAEQAPRVATADEDSALPAWLLAAIDSLSVKSLTEETSSGDDDDEAAVRHSEPAYRDANVPIIRFMQGLASGPKPFPMAELDQSAEVAVTGPSWLDHETEQLYKTMQAEVQPACRAARSGDTNALARLLVAGECPNLAEAATGNTLLILAAGAGHAAVVALLLEFRDIEVDRSNAEGNTALIVAALRNKALVMATLLNAGADINLGNAINGDTALIAAARNGHAEAVKLLLYRMDIQLDERNADGDTALSLAVQNGHEEIFRCLLNAGAALDQACDKDGRSLMTIAVSGGHTRIVQMLRDHPGTG